MLQICRLILKEIHNPIIFGYLRYGALRLITVFAVIHDLFSITYQLFKK